MTHKWAMEHDTWPDGSQVTADQKSTGTSLLVAAQTLNAHP